MQIPMTTEEIYRARHKLYYFFPELFAYSAIEYRSFIGKQKSIEFFLENIPQSIKCIAMDFTCNVSFDMQISTEGNGNLYIHPLGATSNYFFSMQPGIHTKWVSQCKFIPPNESKNEMMMHAEIPFLKENGMGFVIFENDEMYKCEKSQKLKIQFSFYSPKNMPERFTIYILRCSDVVI